MAIAIPTYPKPEQKRPVDPVALSIAKPDACAKPCNMGSKGVRVRVNTGKSEVKIRKKKRNHDPRDVSFY